MEEEILLLIIFSIAAIGTLFLFISAMGIVRLPDVFTRMHAAGKASTLGISSILLSTGIFFWQEEQFWRMVALIVLFLVTAPISTTSMARAAYRTSEHDAFKLDYDDMKEP